MVNKYAILTVSAVGTALAFKHCACQVAKKNITIFANGLLTTLTRLDKLRAS